MTLPAYRPLTYLITTGQATDGDLTTTTSDIITSVKAAVENGISMVQLREKQLSGAELYRLAAELSEIVRGSDTLLFINDRADIAIAVGAHGVHLTSNSLEAKTVRRTFGAKLLIGVSAHSVREVSQAAANGADLAVLGPIFTTPGKERILGLAELNSACRSFSDFPVVALGGINESNFREAIDAGAAGFAAIRSLNDPSEMRRIMNSLQSIGSNR